MHQNNVNWLSVFERVLGLKLNTIIRIGTVLWQLLVWTVQVIPHLYHKTGSKSTRRALIKHTSNTHQFGLMSAGW